MAAIAGECRERAGDLRRFLEENPDAETRTFVQRRLPAGAAGSG